jgi:hypothetical protein
MAKIKINGELFDWDESKKPMSEALAIENGLGMRYADWETELDAGSMRAMCGFVWLVWRRDGRDVPLEDILSGKVEIDLGELLGFMIEEAKARKAAAEAAAEAGQDPTGGAPAPDPSPSTSVATSVRSASSASVRGKSKS